MYVKTTTKQSTLGPQAFDVFPDYLNQNTAKKTCSVRTFCHSVAKLLEVLSQNNDFSPKVNSSRLLRMFLSFIQAKNTKFVALVSICLLLSLAQLCHLVKENH